MLALPLLALAALAPQPAPTEAPQPTAALNPAATELFERDADLADWAARFYDTNKDGWLSTFEAQPALQSFKEIADADRDGRVTVAEFQAAKQFIRARWAGEGR